MLRSKFRLIRSFLDFFLTSFQNFPRFYWLFSAYFSLKPSACFPQKWFSSRNFEIFDSRNQQFFFIDLRDETRHRLRLLSFSTPENSRLGSFLTGVLWLRLRLNIWLVLKTLALFNQFSWFISTLAKAYNLPEYRTDSKTDQNGKSLYQSSRNRYVGRVSKAKNLRPVL